MLKCLQIVKQSQSFFRTFLCVSTQLEPGDHILCVNGEDVKDAPRDHVIQLVRNCDSSVEMVVCQPMHQISLTGRKSTLLSPAKKSKLKARPIRVRFAESVCVNGSPLFPVSRLRPCALIKDSVNNKCHFVSFRPSETFTELSSPFSFHISPSKAISILT